jgi:hypothetical protein
MGDQARVALTHDEDQRRLLWRAMHSYNPRFDLGVAVAGTKNHCLTEVRRQLPTNELRPRIVA